MLEAIQCPACSTRYGLRRERVLPRHTRARCFRCQGEFPISAHVASLLGLPAMEVADDATSTMRFQVEEIKHAHDTGAALDPADLLMGGDDILEKTLVTEGPKPPEDRYPTSPVPEMAPPPEERTASGIEPVSDGRSTGSYKSAKDAISHLFGDAPVPEGPRFVRQTTQKSSLELEATLEALENTLGGTPLAEAAEAQESAPIAEPHVAPVSEPLAAEELPASSSSTQRMSLAELQAAMAAMAPAPEPTPAPAAELDAMEVTQMVDASRLARQMPQDPAATNPVGGLIPSAIGAATSDDPNLLRLRIGDDVYPNLAMDQLIRWVEEGRVLESHLVARQFSENWIEAHKVPGLRPVFERLKRLRDGAPVMGIDSTAPVKKSLFGGLFGKKD